MKKNNKKGFTMAELLIVVAIIGVLVAVAIPVFSSQLTKSQQAVNAANIRSLYAEAMSNAITAADGAGESESMTFKNASKGVGDAALPGGLTWGTYNDNQSLKVTVSSGGTAQITAGSAP